MTSVFRESVLLRSQEISLSLHFDRSDEEPDEPDGHGHEDCSQNDVGYLGDQDRHPSSEALRVQPGVPVRLRFGTALLPGGPVYRFEVDGDFRSFGFPVFWVFALRWEKMAGSLGNELRSSQLTRRCRRISSLCGSMVTLRHVFGRCWRWSEDILNADAVTGITSRGSGTEGNDSHRTIFFG